MLADHLAAQHAAESILTGQQQTLHPLALTWPAAHAVRWAVMFQHELHVQVQHPCIAAEKLSPPCRGCNAAAPTQIWSQSPGADLINSSASVSLSKTMTAA